MHLALLRPIHTPKLKKTKTVNNHVWWSFLYLWKHFPGFAALGGLVIVASNMSQTCSDLPALPRHGQSHCGWEGCVVPPQSQVMGKRPSALPAWLPHAWPLSSMKRVGAASGSPSPCTTSSTSQMKPQMTRSERPQTRSIKVWFSCWSKLGTAAHKLHSACVILKETCFQLGITAEIIQLLFWKTWTIPFPPFFSIF